MRRPNSVLGAAIVALGLSSPIALAQQPASRGTSIPDATGGSAPSSIDPALASRSTRSLLRNGLDYLAYKEYGRALKFFRAAEARQGEFDADETAALRRGIDQAQRGLREGGATNARDLAGRPRRPGALAAAGNTAAEPVMLAQATPVPTPAPAARALPAPDRAAIAPREPAVVRTSARADVPTLAPIDSPPLVLGEPTPLPEPPALDPATPAPTSTPVPAASPAPAAEPTPLPDLPAPASTPLPDTAPTATAQPPVLSLELPDPASSPTPAAPLTPAELPVATTAPTDAVAPVSLPELPPASRRAPATGAPAATPIPLPLPSADPSPSPAVELPMPARSELPALPPAAEAPALPPVAEAPAVPPVVEPPALPPVVDPPPAQDPTPTPAVAPPVEATPAPTEAPATEPVPMIAALPPLPDSAGDASARRLPAGSRSASDLPPAVSAEEIGTRGPRRSAITLSDGTVIPAPVALSSSDRAEIARIARRQDDESRSRLAQVPSRDNPPAPPAPAAPGSGIGGPGGDPTDPNNGSGLGNNSSSTRFELTRAPSPTEAWPIRRIPVPEEFVPLQPRTFEPSRKYWQAPALCHMPLYFQDASLERYGHNVEQFFGTSGRFLSYPIDSPKQSKQRMQIIQPIFSAGLFAFQVGVLPYNLVVDPPWEAEYDLGYHRPGDRIPTDTFYLPLQGVGPPLRGSAY